MRNATEGQRNWALRSTSFSASESLPVTRPMHRGRNGSGTLRSRSNSPSAASVAAQPLELLEQFAEPDVAQFVHLHAQACRPWSRSRA